MSHKVATFVATYTGPKTLDKFLVVIPGFYSPLRVSAAQFPQPFRSVMSINTSGQTYYMPGVEQKSGTWTCTLDESAITDSLTFIKKLRNNVRDVNSLTVEQKLLNIIVILTDQETGLIPVKTITLKSAWLESVTPLQLDWSGPDRPIKWQLTFKFNDLKDFSLRNEQKK